MKELSKAADRFIEHTRTEFRFELSTVFPIHIDNKIWSLTSVYGNKDEIKIIIIQY